VRDGKRAPGYAYKPLVALVIHCEKAASPGERTVRSRLTFRTRCWIFPKIGGIMASSTAGKGLLCPRGESPRPVGTIEEG